MVQRKCIDNGGDITALKYHGNPLARIAFAFGGEQTLLCMTGHWMNKTDCHRIHWLHVLRLFVMQILCFIKVKELWDFERIWRYTHDIHLRNLVNKSPLNSFACGPYDGPLDGGHPTQMEGTGGLTVCINLVVM
eukprot:336703_1